MIQQWTARELLGPLNDLEQRFAPTFLYTAGDSRLLRSGPRVSVIGSRRASSEKLEVAKDITAQLVRHGVVVVSGLAEGVDTAAHSAAMQAGGHTIAVLGTPIDEYFPRQNRGLQDRIAREHLVISQFPRGTTTQPRNFPQRNRTMALISHASIIVEASETSGTQHQGWEALRLGRPLFFLSDLVDEIGVEWPRKMMEYGATALRRDDIWTVLDELPLQLQSEFVDEIG